MSTIQDRHSALIRRVSLCRVHGSDTLCIFPTLTGALEVDGHDNVRPVEIPVLIHVLTSTGPGRGGAVIECRHSLFLTLRVNEVRDSSLGH